MIDKVCQPHDIVGRWKSILWQLLSHFWTTKSTSQHNKLQSFGVTPSYYANMREQLRKNYKSILLNTMEDWTREVHVPVVDFSTISPIHPCS